MQGSGRFQGEGERRIESRRSVGPSRSEPAGGDGSGSVLAWRGGFSGPREVVPASLAEAARLGNVGLGLLARSGVISLIVAGLGAAAQWKKSKGQGDDGESKSNADGHGRCLPISGRSPEGVRRSLPARVLPKRMQIKSREEWEECPITFLSCVASPGRSSDNRL
jgi:hypothetical protein